MTSPPETRYARSGDVSVAYQVTGEGPFDVVYVPPFISNVELAWEVPEMASFYERLSSFCRLIRFDKRGQGMSDRVSGVPAAQRREAGRPSSSSPRSRRRRSISSCSWRRRSGFERGTRSRGGRSSRSRRSRRGAAGARKPMFSRGSVCSSVCRTSSTRPSLSHFRGDVAPGPDGPLGCAHGHLVGPELNRSFSAHVARKSEGANQAEAAFRLRFPGSGLGSLASHRYRL